MTEGIRTMNSIQIAHAAGSIKSAYWNVCLPLQPLPHDCLELFLRNRTIIKSANHLRLLFKTDRNHEPI